MTGPKSPDINSGNVGRSMADVNPGDEFQRFIQGSDTLLFNIKCCDGVNRGHGFCGIDLVGDHHLTQIVKGSVFLGKSR